MTPTDRAWFSGVACGALAAVTGIMVASCTVDQPKAYAAAPDVEPLRLVIVTESRRWTSGDVFDRLETASQRARCVVESEIGGVGFDPYAVSRTNDLGPVQLNTNGLLREFLAENTDPFSPKQSIDFLEAKLAEGRGSNWRAVATGRC